MVSTRKLIPPLHFLIIRGNLQVIFAVCRIMNEKNQEVKGENSEKGKRGLGVAVSVNAFLKIAIFAD